MEKEKTLNVQVFVWREDDDIMVNTQKNTKGLDRATLSMLIAEVERVKLNLVAELDDLAPLMEVDE